MRYLKIFENFNQQQYDPNSYTGCGCCPVCTGEEDCECGCPECNCPDDQNSDKFAEFQNWFNSNNFTNKNIDSEFEDFFTEIMDSDLSNEEKAHEIAAYLDEKCQLYDRYIEVVDYLDELLSE
jgi:hypothetical protein